MAWLISPLVIATLFPIGQAVVQPPKPPAAPAKKLAAASVVEVTIDVEEAPQAKAWAVDAKGLIEKWHPKIAALLPSPGYSPPTKVKLIFRKKLAAPAVAAGASIIVSAEWIAEHPDDYGMVVHELTHVIQAYPGGSSFWLTEGIADYIRFFKYEPTVRIEPPTDARTTYREGYRTSAAFLAWAQKKYDENLVRKLNEALRTQKYSDTLFERCTGRNLDALWREYFEASRKKKSKARSNEKASLKRLEVRFSSTTSPVSPSYPADVVRQGADATWRRAVGDRIPPRCGCVSAAGSTSVRSLLRPNAFGRAAFAAPPVLRAPTSVGTQALDIHAGFLLGAKRLVLSFAVP